jgi:hypothetical protein
MFEIYSLIANKIDYLLNIVVIAICRINGMFINLVTIKGNKRNVRVTA